MFRKQYLIPCLLGVILCVGAFYAMALSEKGGLPKEPIEMTKQVKEMIGLLEHTIYPRLKTYAAGPLFNEMTPEDAMHGTQGDCSHAVLWTAMEMDKRNIPFRVLDIRSRDDINGTPIGHAMIEVKLDGKWLLADPLNGWLFPKDMQAMREAPADPVNDSWKGRKEFAAYYRSAWFYHNIEFIEAYTDLAYTGLFPPKQKDWRSVILDERSQTTKLDGHINLPVSMARLDDRTLAVASYLSLWSVDTMTGKVREIRKPEGVEHWFPTGLAYDRRTRELFIANYLGKDLLILRRKADGQFALAHRVTDPEMVGAENVSLSANGKWIAVADFDNSGILLFDRAKLRKVWYTALGRAHGVAFDKNDEYIYAAGLAPPRVARLDLKGNMQQYGEEGWGDDGYLWPTGVALDPVTGHIWVSDAHNGAIRRLDGTLHTQERFGGNGLGYEWFNMPYSSFFDTDGTMWVTDTFKSRLIKLDKNHKPQHYYVSSLDAGVLSPLCPDPDACKPGTLLTQPPMGEHYIRRINEEGTLRNGFGFTGNNARWFTGFNFSAFTSPDRKHSVSLASAAPAFASSIYYWVQAHAVKDSDIIVYGSPQVREWIVQDGDFICPVTLDLNFWKTDEGLARDDGHMVPYGRLLAYCQEKKATFLEAMKDSSDAVTQYATHVRKMQPSMFASYLPQSFTTEEGLAYRDALCKAKTAMERYRLSRAFIGRMQRVKGRYQVSLPELWTARLIGWKEPRAGETVIPLTCAAGA